MYVVILDPNTGETLSSRKLGGREVMDARTFADEFAQLNYGVSVDESDGYIPNCCGDIRVEFRRDPDDSVCIWSGESFYLKTE
jgi:hypothetical protein